MLHLNLGKLCFNRLLYNVHYTKIRVKNAIRKPKRKHIEEILQRILTLLLKNLKITI